ncbi:Glutathione peroxidase 3 [Lamellibrachia satsuma]|nr:Glutathione peroxidase 3 [Lamellibrachia satsuma]
MAVGWSNLLAFAAFVVGSYGTSDEKDVNKVFCYNSRSGEQSIYDHGIRDIYLNGPIDWSQYRGKVVLVDSFKDFKVLGVPCNQFALQEPGDNGTEIINSLKYVRPGNGFEPNFELTEKINVNGPNEHPLYTYLKSHCPPAWQSFANKYRLHYEGLQVRDVRWNFEKFLVDRKGVPLIRYSETFLPSDIMQDIQNLLAASD